LPLNGPASSCLRLKLCMHSHFSICVTCPANHILLHLVMSWTCKSSNLTKKNAS
jgi:hypothetical protein